MTKSRIVALFCFVVSFASFGQDNAFHLRNIGSPNYHYTKSGYFASQKYTTSAQTLNFFLPFNSSFGTVGAYAVESTECEKNFFGGIKACYVDMTERSTGTAVSCEIELFNAGNSEIGVEYWDCEYDASTIRSPIIGRNVFFIQDREA